MARFLPGLPKRDAATEAPARKPTLPPPGVLRRQRRALHKAREQLVRDLGGLVFEMFRQDRFRADLVQDRCQELLEIDERLEELDTLLIAGRNGLPAMRCQCGAPLPWGSHFCPNCGRPAGEKAVVGCDVCGHALPADAAFCAACGAPASPPELILEAAPQPPEPEPEQAVPGAAPDGEPVSEPAAAADAPELGEEQQAEAARS